MNFEIGKYYKIPCAELIGPKGKGIFWEKVPRREMSASGNGTHRSQWG
ncbi:hypothetical protein LEP1GSC166_1881 [Leptospira kirschneri]|nr:hypothetical protein [Leptospira kirschneri]EMK02862.1 hypothetical protein LEP1GSC166_1881 [Leptospira kirschneri]